MKTRMGLILSIAFLNFLVVVYTLCQYADAAEKSESDQYTAVQELSVIPAPEEYCAKEIGSSGSLEIQVFGSSFVLQPEKEPNGYRFSSKKPGFLIKSSADFNYEESDIELGNAPMSANIPARIEMLTPGIYYVGISLPVPGRYGSGAYRIPYPVTEDLAWDGAMVVTYRANPDILANGNETVNLFLQRWYKILVESGKTSLVSALFFRRTDDLNIILSEVAQLDLCKYPVSIDSNQPKEAFGVKQPMLNDLLGAIGKVFLPKDFLPGVVGIENVCYLTDTTSGIAKIACLEDIEKEESDRGLIRINDVAKKIMYYSSVAESATNELHKAYQQKTQSDGILEAELVEQNWEGLPAGMKFHYGGNERTLTHDLAHIEVSINIKNNSAKQVPVPEWNLVDRNDDKIELGSFGLLDGERKSFTEGDVYISPNKNKLIHLRSSANYLAYQRANEPLYLVDNELRFRWELKRIPDKATLYSNHIEDGCFYSLNLELVDQQWEKIFKGSRITAGEDKLNLAEDMIIGNFSIKVQNISEAAIELPLLFLLDSKEDPLAELIIEDSEEAPIESVKIPSGENIIVKLVMPMENYDRLMGLEPLYISDQNLTWQLKLAPIK